MLIAMHFVVQTDEKRQTCTGHKHTRAVSVGQQEACGGRNVFENEYIGKSYATGRQRSPGFVAYIFFRVVQLV